MINIDKSVDGLTPEEILSLRLNPPVERKWAHDERCASRSPRSVFFCTREPGHPGPHAYQSMVNANNILDAWSNTRDGLSVPADTLRT